MKLNNSAVKSSAPIKKHQFAKDLLRNAVKPLIETLEKRQMLSTTLWVNDNWVVTTDVGTPGLSNGDSVDNSGLGDDGQVSDVTVPGLQFGTTAFQTIGDAQTAAAAGDTIRVLSGIYNTSTVITKNNLSILGGTPSSLGDNSGIDKSTIDGRNASRDPAGSPVREVLFINGGGLQVNSSGVTVAGFTLRDNFTSSPLSISGGSATIKNNVFTRNVFGLNVAGSNADVQQNYFVQNDRSGTNRSQGINVNSGATGVSIHDNTLLTHNTAGAARPGGVVVEGSGTSATINNNFIAKSTVGVRIGSGASANITNNNFEGGVAQPDNATDIHFESGAGTPGSITLNALAGTEYIRNLSGQAITALASSNTYKKDNTNTETDNFAIEARIFHKVDNAASGVVSWVNNNIFVTPTLTPTATNNDYTRIANAVDGMTSGTTVNLQGTFNWTETNAAASWALGNDAISGNDDDYSVKITAGIASGGITAASLGAATIHGPGDLAGANLEGVFYFNGGDNQNWQISNLVIDNFDLGIGMFNGAGGTDAFNGLEILNNHIIVAKDLNAVAAPSDASQNIGIHYSFGANQTIQGNIIDLQGDAVSNGSNFATSVGMQSNTSGGAVYDGLLINNNTINVYGAQDATNPGVILGIWENAHAHTSNITVSNNQFINQDAGNNSATNLQRAFRVTSHSGASSTVTYSGNVVQGANIGLQWIAGSNFTGNQPVEVVGNTLTKVNTGLLIQSNGLAHLTNNTLDNTGIAAGNSVGLKVDAGSTATVNASVAANEIKGFEIGVKVLGNATISGNAASIHGNAIGIDVDGGTATISGNHIYDSSTAGIRIKNGGSASVTSNNFEGGANDNVTDVQLVNAASAITGAMTGNDFAGSIFFIDNQSNSDITALSTTAGGTNTYTETNNFRIEDKVHHAVDTDLAATNGLVTWNLNDVYVTSAGTDHSIQRGIDVATAGDTVNVEAGTYALSSGVIVNKQVTLLGAQSGVDARTRAGAESIVDASAVAAFPGAAFTVQSGVNQAVIDGFTVQGAAGAQGIAGIYLAPGSNSTTVQNNILTNNVVGLYLANTSATTPLVVSQNLFIDNTAPGAASGHGIYADDSTTGGSLTNVDITNNAFTNTAFVTDSWGVGISNVGATAFTDLNISGNDFSNMGRGMYLYNTASSTISGNTVAGATRYAIGLFGNNGTPANANLTITGNILNSNGKGVYLADDTSASAYSGTLTLTGNQYNTSGAQSSIYNDSATPITATGETFNSVLASSASLPQQYVLVDTIRDGVDASGRALVRTQAGHVFVTTDSYFADFGTTTPQIQRGVDLALSGNIVNVEAGSFANSVAVVTPNVTVLGAGSALTTIDYTGLPGTGNAGVYINANNVTLQGFTVTQTVVDSTPRYGVKADLVSGVTLSDLNVSNSYRSGVDLHGLTNATVTNVNSHDNGGAGIFMTDVKGAALSSITTSNNPWTGVSVATSGQFATLGTNGIVFSGINSFGESAGANGGLQLEKFNYATNTPSVITWSTVPSDNADVTILPADFSHALSGLNFDGGTNTHAYVRFYNSLAQAQAAAAGSPDHIDANNRFIRTTNGLTVPTTYKIYDTPGDKMSINAAVVDSKNDDVVTVGAGTFNEAVNWNKRVNIIGSGSGVAGTVVSKLSSSPIFSITGSGASSAFPLLLQNIRITPVVVNAMNVPSSISNLKLDNVSVIGTGIGDNTENETGLWVNPTASINGLTIQDSKFNELTYGLLFQKHGDWGTGASNVSNVLVTNTEFDHNAAKGIYAEKLTDATFTNVTVTDNGWDTGFFNAPFNAGIDINLKGEVTYQNLVFNNLTVTGNAFGAANGVGLALKARGGAGETNPDYVAHPAALDGVQINGGTFTGNQNGIRVGEPGKSNPSPTNVVISGSANINNNVGAGVLLVGGQTQVLGGTIGGNAVGISVDSGKAFIQGVDLRTNSVAVRSVNGAKVDAGSDVGDPDLTGFGHSTGGNDVRGYSGLGGSYSFENLNLVASSHPKVYARFNNFGPLTNTGIENTIKDDTDSATLTQVVFSQVPPVVTPTIVYVNDDWTAVPNGVDADPANGVAQSGTLFGYDQFLTITDAIAAVDDGGTVVVFGGDYNEAVVANKAGLTLESRQDLVIGADTQAIVTRTSGTNSVVMEVTADNVTIDGFNVVINRPNSTVGIGAANDAGTTFSGGSFNNVVIKNNTITSSGAGGLVDNIGLSTNASGIALVGNGGVIENVTLQNNTVDITTSGGEFRRRAVYLRAVTGNITGNDLKGIANDLIDQFATGATTTISGNTFRSGGVDLTENGTGGNINLTNNQFLITTPTSSQSLVIKHDVAAPITVSGNTFSGHAIGVSMGNSTDVTFNNNTFTPGAAATTVDIVFDTANFTGGTPSAPFAPVNATITNNTFNGRAGTGDTAIALWNRNPGAQSPDYGTMTIGTSGNENTFGADINTAIYLDAGTLGGAAVTKNLDAQNNKFVVTGGTKLPAAMNLAERFEVEDKITHAIDVATVGFVTVVPDQYFVTPASFVTGFTSTADIQRGVDLAGTTDTVHVKAGTYLNDLNIVGPTKAGVSVIGAGAGTTTINYEAQPGTGNAGVYINANDVTFKGFAVTQTTVDSTPRYGVKVDLVDGVTLDDLNVSNSFRTGVDLHGDTDITVTNINSHNNGGAGIFMTDVKGAALSGITTSANSWTGVSIGTSGVYAPLGTNNVVFSGTNSFGESASDNGGLQLEMVNYTNNTFNPISWSKRLSDGANVTIQSSDFGYALSGHAFSGPEHYVRFYNSLSQAESAAAGNPDHITAGSRFIQEADDSNGLAGSTVTNFFVFDNGGNTPIQAAIDAAVPNDYINVAAGTYSENVTVNKHVTIDGAGSGNGVGDTVISKLSNTPIFTITGSGASNASPLLLKDLRIAPVTVHGLDVPNATSVAHLKLDNVAVVGTGITDNSEAETGLWVNTTGSINDLSISNSKFDNLTYGWYLQKHGDWGVSSSNVKNVVVNNTEFSGNRVKGLYAEKLSDATFTNVTVSNNGLDTGFFNAAFNAGVDINLKGEALYQNLAFNNLTVSGNAIGAANGVGLTVKARGGAGETNPDYVAHPATVNNVTVTGGSYSGNQNGIRFGEPGKSNPTPTGVVVSGASITGNTQNGVMVFGGQVQLDGNTITGNTVAGVVATGGNATIKNNNLNGNAIGVLINDGSKVDLGQTASPTNFTGAGISTGGNNFSGYTTTATSSAGAIVDLKTLAPQNTVGRKGIANGDVPAFNNTWAVATPAGIENVVYHDSDNPALGFVDFSSFGNLSTSVSSPTVNEGSSITASGSFTNVPQAHTVTVSWGDGSPNTVLNLSSGTFNFTTPAHIYTDDQNGPSNFTNRTVTITVVENATATALPSATHNVAVSNVAPSVVVNGSAATIDEGGAYSVTFGSVTDPGTDTPQSYAIDFGDGNFVTVDGNSLPITGPGTYLSPLNYDGPQTYTIRVRVVDEDGPFTAGTTTVNVNNLDPTTDGFVAASPSVTEGTSNTVFWLTPSDPSVDDAANLRFDYDINGDGDYNDVGIDIIGSASSSAVVPGSQNTIGTHTVNSRMYDNDGTFTNPADPNDGYVLSSTTYTVTSGTFKVSSVAVTPSGFDITFNHPYNSSVLNLYGANPDVIVTKSGNPVRGSLVFTSPTVLSWIGSGGPLASGTYTLRLKSGSATAFIDADASPGDQLDGNGNNVPGDDYLNTGLSVAAPGRFITIPDFSRGPGQEIDLPAPFPESAAGTVGSALTVSDGTNVRGVQFKLVFDSSKYSIREQDLQLGANALAINGWTIQDIPGPSSQLLTSGQIIVVNSATNSLGAGVKEVLKLHARVPNDMSQYGKNAAVRLDDVVFSIFNGITTVGTPGTGDDALEAVVYTGDTDKNAYYDTADISNIASIVLLDPTPFALGDLPNTDPKIIADIDLDGFVDVNDINLMTTEALVFPTVAGSSPEIPEIPGANIGMARFGTGTTQLVLPGTVTPATSTTVAVPVKLTMDARTGPALTFDVTYDPTALSFSEANGVTLTTQALSLGLQYAVRLMSPGVAKILIFSGDTTASINSSDLLRLNFGVVPSKRIRLSTSVMISGVDNRAKTIINSQSTAIRFSTRPSAPTGDLADGLIPVSELVNGETATTDLFSGTAILG